MNRRTALQSVIISALSALKTHNEDYCDIETIDSGSNIVFKNGAMMTLFKYDGLMSLPTPDEFFDLVNFLAKELNSLMQKPGYKIACVFRKDLDSYPLVEQSEKVQKTTARKIGLDLEALIDENIEIYKNGVYNEEVWFALITQPMVLDKIEVEMLKEERRAHIGPALRNAQNIMMPLDILRAKHQSFTSKFFSAISNKQFHTKIEMVNVLNGLNFIRSQVIPEFTHKKWIPSVAIGREASQYLGFKDYRTPITWPITQDKHDLSYLFPPNLSRQIMGSQSISVLGQKDGLPNHTVAIGGRLYASTMMDIAPNQPSVFNSLFSAFNQNTTKDLQGRKVTIPWSVSFMLTSDGMASMSIKNVLAAVLARIPPSSNLSIARALEQLRYVEREKLSIVSLQLCAMTWVEDTPDAKKLLAERKVSLQSTLGAWGGMTTKDNVGDPVMLWRSNILGLSSESVGTRAAIQLSHAISLLPLARPASPFNRGTVLHKTLDGKLMPLEKFSSQQNTWVTIITGTPGSGKSVLMNKLLYETCLMPGIQRLPWISIIDKGISSTGLINLLREALRPEMRHLVAARRLRKDRKSAINPFDIKPGLTYPLESERTQMVSFLSTMMTPPESEKPYDDTTTFCAEIIKLAFDSVQEQTGTPKMYKTYYNRELDGILQEYHILNYAEKTHIDEFGRTIRTPDYETFDDVTYFSLVRKLHHAGEKTKNARDRFRLWRGRDLAQRYAVPVLPDLISIIESDQIKKNFTNIVGSQETMPVFAQRAIRSIISEYECFSNATEFDVDTARVLSLDLQDVIDKNNRKQTALFFQAARMIAVKKFSLSEEDVNPEKIPSMFLPYYRNMLRELSMDRKTLAYDEFSNAKEDLATMKQVETDAREGRKWGTELILASQYIKDFKYSKGDKQTDSVNLLDLATTVCICSRPQDENLALFKQSITAHAGVLDSFGMIGISGHGLTYFSYFVTKNGHYSAYITNQVGHKMMWSLTTDQVDRSMRSAMLAKVPNLSRAMSILAWAFGGGVSSRYQERAAVIGDALTDQQRESLIDTMAEEAIYAYENYERQQKMLKVA